MGTKDSPPECGKFLLVGPQWDGQKPEEFVDVLRMPTSAWMPGTAGSSRKTPACGAATGSDVPWRHEEQIRRAKEAHHLGQ